MVVLDLECVLDSDESAEMFDFAFCGKISMFTPRTATVLCCLVFDVVVEMTCIVVGSSCTPCALVAVVKSSSMVVVWLLSEPDDENEAVCKT